MTNERELALPSAPDAERLVLGAVMAMPETFETLRGAVAAEDFHTEVHRILFKRMCDLSERGDPIDRVTVFTELQKNREAEACGGLTYLVSLDDGLPQIPNIEAYARIVREKSVLRKTIFACQHMMNRCMAASGESHEILTDAEGVLQKLVGESRQERVSWRNPGEIMVGYPGGIDAFLSPQKHESGLVTPWPALTSATGGWHTGELAVIAGRPSMGKSLIAMQIAVMAAKHFRSSTPEESEVAAIFSLEMSKESLIQRLLSAEGRVDAQKFRMGYLSYDERKKLSVAVGEIEDLPLWIDDSHARTVPAMVSALRKLQATRGQPRLIVVDHLQLVRSVGRVESLRVGLTEVTHALKHIATDFGATVILCSQLNRDCEKENRRPQQSDLRESGSIEEDADVIAFVHRWERYQKFRDRDDMRGQAELIIAKQRNGPIGAIRLVFLESQQKFESQVDYGEMQHN